jgi:hypothetical protein
MIRNRFTATVALMLVVASMAACGQEAVEADMEEPAIVEEIDGTDLHRITLTAKAATRLDIQTAPIQEATVDGQSMLAMPYGALLWDAEGAAWAYTSLEELVFVRAAVSLDHIDGDRAILLDGPAPGTSVVMVGAAELWGAENGVGGGH